VLEVGCEELPPDEVDSALEQLRWVVRLGRIMSMLSPHLCGVNEIKEHTVCTSRYREAFFHLCPGAVKMRYFSLAGRLEGCPHLHSKFILHYLNLRQPCSPASFRIKVPALLLKMRLDHVSVRVQGTPRRLAVMVEGLAPRQKAEEARVRGPPASVSVAVVAAGLMKIKGWLLAPRVAMIKFSQLMKW
jgi:hypothetical protein